MPPAAESKQNDHGDVTATLTFAAHDSPVPRRIVYPPPHQPGHVEEPAKMEQHQRTIFNGRDKDLTLRNNGLQLVPQPTQMTNEDFYDSDKIEKIFYPECEAAIKKHLPGVSKFIIFNHIVRGNKKNEEKAKLKGGSSGGDASVQAPVLLAHNDFTATSAPWKVKDMAKADKSTTVNGNKDSSWKEHVDASDVEELEKKRYIFLNVWRNIADYPVLDFPLAVCDGQTMNKEDLLTMRLQYPDREVEACMVKNQEAHRWYYFKEMKNDEAMLLKCYDSEEHNGRWTAHSAFSANPPEGSKPRQSIEVRTLAFFD